MLAERLGYTVAELEQRMTFRELVEWAAYLRTQGAPPGAGSARPWQAVKHAMIQHKNLQRGGRRGRH